MSMNAILRGGAMAGMAVAGVLSLTTGGTPSDTSRAFAAERIERVEVTMADVTESNRKVAMAHGALADMWSARFAGLGTRFAVPRVVRYRGGAMSACGPMRRNNAGYCPASNTIYFDEIFVAAQARSAAGALGTDGDMAAIGIIAHEMGHAVAMQLGYASRVTYHNEAIADCLAGAFAEQAGRDGSLENGDIEEAFHGMAAAADPAPELTGDRRIDGRILRNAALMGHGTREQRTSNFRRGLDGGAGACLEELGQRA